MFVQEQKGHGEVWCFSAELEPIKSPDIQSFIFTEASQLVCAVCNSSWWTKDSSESLNRTNNCREGEQEGRKEGLLCLGVYGGKTIKDGGGHGERETLAERGSGCMAAGPSQVTCQRSVFVLPSRGRDGRPTRHIQTEPQYL